MGKLHFRVVNHSSCSVGVVCNLKCVKTHVICYKTSAYIKVTP